jgi:uncharacterized membrane protein
MKTESVSVATRAAAESSHHLRFHLSTSHLSSVFGGDRFGQRAESFARFFGTPTFLISQTIVVGIWIAINVVGVVKFDLYPFILLNLAFSLQAAYAAPLILLAQTRQADRDKANMEADAMHREELSAMGARSLEQSNQNLLLLLELVRENTELTELTHQLSTRIAELSTEIRDHIRSENKEERGDD